MSVSRRTMAAIRFGYGFRDGQTAPDGPDALMAELRPGSKQPPPFGAGGFFQRGAMIMEMHDLLKRKKATTGPDRAAIDREAQKARNRILRAFSEDQHARIIQAVTSPHGFYERLAYFWTNHFAVVAHSRYLKGVVATQEAEAIRPHIAGRFRDMLEAAAFHPAMLFFLNQRSSIGPNSRAGRRRGRGLNENLAREILELHTLGAKGGYDQADVTNFAKLLTGVTVHRRRRETIYRPQRAEPGVHRVLGQNYGRAGQTAGMPEVDRALDAIAAHPSTAAYVSGKLARHFVSDTPSDALVDAMTAAWRKSDGDLPTVYRAMLEHRETWARFGEKVKTPFDFLVSGLRAVGAAPQQMARPRSKRANRFTVGALRKLNHAPWLPSGPDGYPDDNASWLTPQGLAGRIEWAGLVGRRAARVLDPRQGMRIALADTARPDTRFVVEGASERWEGLALVLASPEFNRR